MLCDVIEISWWLISRSTQNRLKMTSLNFRVGLCRIRLSPKLISKVKWTPLWTTLNLTLIQGKFLIYEKLIDVKLLRTYSVLFEIRPWARPIYGKLIQNREFKNMEEFSKLKFRKNEFEISSRTARKTEISEKFLDWFSRIFQSGLIALWYVTLPISVKLSVKSCRRNLYNWLFLINSSKSNISFIWSQSFF